MNPEAKVRQLYPHATIEKQTTYGGERYYLVRLNQDEEKSFYPYASGPTKAKAWRDAWEKLSLEIKNK